jgi:hypothetical protein
MGFLHSGPFGSLNGRTGNNVGRWSKGKNVFSIRPHKSSKKATQAQLNVRAKFTLMAEFLANATTLIELGFKAYESEMSPMNAAVGFNIKNAVTGIAPNFAVDYSKIIFSRGKQVAEPSNGGIASITAGYVDFTWDATTIGNRKSKITDKANFMVYNPTTDEFVILEEVVERSEAEFALQVPSHFSGDLVHCYMNFISLEKRVSDTTYLGALTLI